MIETLLFAICLAALAGWVDAIAFIHFHGVFVSFMSGNSTQAAVAAAKHDVRGLVELARTILLFVVGVAVAELAAALSERWRRPIVLTLEAIMLGAAYACARFGFDAAVFAAFLALAMGIQNAAVHKAGELTVGLTYVTGTLVQTGRRCAGVLRGAEPWHSPLPFLGLWTGLVSGGLCGAVTADHSLSTALLAALGTCLVFLIYAYFRCFYRRTLLERPEARKRA